MKTIKKTIKRLSIVCLMLLFPYIAFASYTEPATFYDNSTQQPSSSAPEAWGDYRPMEVAIDWSGYHGYVEGPGKPSQSTPPVEIFREEYTMDDADKGVAKPCTMYPEEPGSLPKGFDEEDSNNFKLIAMRDSDGSCLYRKRDEAFRKQAEISSSARLREWEEEQRRLDEIDRENNVSGY